MRKRFICSCPECRKGDIYRLGSDLYTSCRKNWTLEEIYPLIWFDQLMKLARRKQRQKVRAAKVSSIESIEKEIAFTCKKFKELELYIYDLEDALKAAEYALNGYHIDDMEKVLEMKQHRLMITQQNLKKLYLMRDELTTHYNESSQYNGR